VLAADGYGAGKGPAWPVDRVVRLGDEVALLEPVFARAGRPFSLVGHSYGAAVALLAALRQPRSVKALALYEPTLFSVVDAESPSPNDVDGIRNAVALAVTALKSPCRRSRYWTSRCCKADADRCDDKVRDWLSRARQIERIRSSGK
jgi:pimeloyl-ACP methyl ester carboxylesterase